MAPKVESPVTEGVEKVTSDVAWQVDAPVVVEMFDIPRGNRRIEQQIAEMAFDVF